MMIVTQFRMVISLGSFAEMAQDMRIAGKLSKAQRHGN